jgi:hypothetical protein
MSILDITAALFRERRRVVIALGFAAAVAIVPVSAANYSEHAPNGVERSVAECLPFTDICFPDPAPLLGGEPAPIATPAPAPPPPDATVDQITINGKETLINSGPS